MGSFYAFWMYDFYQPPISSIKISQWTVSAIEKKRCPNFQQSHRIIQKTVVLLNPNPGFPSLHQNNRFPSIWSPWLNNHKNICCIEYKSSEEIGVWFIRSLSHTWLPNGCL
jgi:hypothetical protein